MNQTITQPQTAYWFTESLDIARRDTPKSPVVASKYTQCGFYLIESRVEDSTIQRVTLLLSVGGGFNAPQTDSDDPSMIKTNTAKD